MDEETQRLNLLERKIRRPRLASSDAEEISEDLDVSHRNNTLQNILCYIIAQNLSTVHLKTYFMRNIYSNIATYQTVSPPLCLSLFLVVCLTCFIVDEVLPSLCTGHRDLSTGPHPGQEDPPPVTGARPDGQLHHVRPHKVPDRHLQRPMEHPRLSGNVCSNVTTAYTVAGGFRVICPWLARQFRVICP